MLGFRSNLIFQSRAKTQYKVLQPGRVMTYFQGINTLAYFAAQVTNKKFYDIDNWSTESWKSKVLIFFLNCKKMLQNYYIRCGFHLVCKCNHCAWFFNNTKAILLFYMFKKHILKCYRFCKNIFFSKSLEIYIFSKVCAIIRNNCSSSLKSWPLCLERDDWKQLVRFFVSPVWSQLLLLPFLVSMLLNFSKM